MKILIADDDPLSVHYLQDMLREWGFEVVSAADGAAALALLHREDGPSIAILDSLLAGEDGLALCRAIRDTIGERYVYIIMLAAQADAAFVATAMDAGADDYIGKPFGPERVRVRVRAGARIAELEEKLRFRESRDEMTGVYNRATIIELLQKELARRDRTHHSVSVILCDVDHLTALVDTHGHQAGAELMREVARRMGATLRPYDTFGRYGTEEMLSVLPNCDMQGALEVAERMRASVADVAVATCAGDIDVTVSIGVAAVEGDRPGRLPDVMERADEALHRARQNGRNCITVAS